MQVASLMLAAGRVVHAFVSCLTYMCLGPVRGLCYETQPLCWLLPLSKLRPLAARARPAVERSDIDAGGGFTTWDGPVIGPQCSNSSGCTVCASLTAYASIGDCRSAPACGFNDLMVASPKPCSSHPSLITIVPPPRVLPHTMQAGWLAQAGRLAQLAQAGRLARVQRWPVSPSLG